MLNYSRVSPSPLPPPQLTKNTTAASPPPTTQPENPVSTPSLSQMEGWEPVTPGNCLEKSCISTLTQIEVQVPSGSENRSLSPVYIPTMEARQPPPAIETRVELPEPRHLFHELPSTPVCGSGGDAIENGTGRMVANGPEGQQPGLKEWWPKSRGSVLLVLVVAIAASIQFLMKSGMQEDFSWWKLVTIRAIFQCAISLSVIMAKHFFSSNPNHQFSCTFSLTSHRWIYFSQVLKSCFLTKLFPPKLPAN